jgi:hypothetical protein
LANRAIKPIRIGYTKWLGLFRQPWTGSVLPIDGRSISPVNTAELNYTVTEKEFLEVVHAINKFRHYITCYEVFVHTDHSAIRFLMNKPITNG